MKLFTKKELLKRSEMFSNQLSDHNIDAAMLTLNSDLFYFTGSVQKGVLLIKKDGNAIWFVRKNFERALSESEIDIKPFDYDAIKAEIKDFNRIGIPFDTMTINELKWFESKLMTKKEIVDVSLPLALSKTVKTETEIEFMKKAGKMNAAIPEVVNRIYKKGMKDIELQSKFDYIMRTEYGHAGFVWTRGTNMDAGISLVVTGKSALEPTYTDFPIGGKGLSPYFAQGVSGETIENTLVVDFIGTYHGYNADSTRTFFIGKPSEEHAAIYNDLIELLEKLTAYMTTEVTAEESWNYLKTLLNNYSWKDNFMGLKQKVGFIGHGIGNEVNQLPVIAPRQRTTIRENMVIALEPKVFIENYGIIGLENTYHVTKDGWISITGEFPPLEEIILN